jgi:hypothetical protein
MYFLYQNEYRIFKPDEITIRRGIGRKEENGDEAIQVIIHIHTEMSQGNSLYSYLKQTKFLFFSETENRKAKPVLSGGLVPVGGVRI